MSVSVTKATSRGPVELRGSADAVACGMAALSAHDELLAALQNVLGTCGAFSPRGKIAIEAARAAIAKATQS
jgi:hypothetical protein